MKMSYEEYEQKMDELQKEFDRCASIDDYTGMDRVQNQMDRLTNTVSTFHTNQIKRNGW
jgi:hypothetical protein